MNASRLLTLADLVRIGVCQPVQDRFAKLFGTYVEVTEELAERYADEFDFNSAARKLLGDAARAKYRRIVAPARAEYRRICDATYHKYKRTIAPVRAKYRRTIARKFARLYIGEIT